MLLENFGLTWVFYGARYAIVSPSGRRLPWHKVKDHAAQCAHHGVQRHRALLQGVRKRRRPAAIGGLPDHCDARVLQQGKRGARVVHPDVIRGGDGGDQRQAQGFLRHVPRHDGRRKLLGVRGAGAAGGFHCAARGRAGQHGPQLAGLPPLPVPNPQRYTRVGQTNCQEIAKAARDSESDAGGGRRSNMRNRRRRPDRSAGEFAGAGEQLDRYDVFLGRRGELHDDPERTQLLHTSERRRRQRRVSGSLQEGRAGLQEHGGNRGVRSSTTPRVRLGADTAAELAMMKSGLLLPCPT